MTQENADNVIGAVFQHYDGKGPSYQKRMLLYVWLLEASQELKRVRTEQMRRGMSWQERNAVERAALQAGQRRFDDLVAAYEAHFGHSIYESYKAEKEDTAK